MESEIKFFSQFGTNLKFFLEWDKTENETKNVSKWNKFGNETNHFS